MLASDSHLHMLDQYTRLLAQAKKVFRPEEGYIPRSPGCSKQSSLIRWTMARKTNRTPGLDLDNGNLLLAQTILDAIKIKENAGLVRNPFTGRACHKLTDEEAACKAAPDENTAQLAALILETRKEAFVAWALKIQHQHRSRASKEAAEKISPSNKKSKLTVS